MLLQTWLLPLVLLLPSLCHPDSLAKWPLAYLLLRSSLSPYPQHGCILELLIRDSVPIWGKLKCDWTEHLPQCQLWSFLVHTKSLFYSQLFQSFCFLLGFPTCFPKLHHSLTWVWAVFRAWSAAGYSRLVWCHTHLVASSDQVTWLLAPCFTSLVITL